MDREEQLEKVADIAKKAGELLLKMQQQSLPEISKDGADSTSEADIASQKIVISGLREIDNEIPILAEEKLAGFDLLVPDDATTNLPESYWSVDPLDGTAVYANNCPEYSVSIALVENHQPVLSVIYQPALNVLVTAQQNNWTYLNRKKINLEKIKEPDQWLVGLDMNKAVSDKFDREVFLPLTKKFRYVRNVPGVASIVELLQGRTGLYVTSNHRNWDIAAGALAVQEAGGIIQQLSGEPLDWRLVRMPPLAAATDKTMLADLHF